MLLPPDTALIRRDPAIPGLELLFDPAALVLRLRAAGTALPDLSPAYVRYKRGTSCLVAYRTEAGAPPALYAVARRRSDACKVNKAMSAPDAAAFGTARLADEVIEVRSMRHDAELTALPRVLDPLTRRLMLVKRAAHVPHLHDCTSRPLAYKPERRFVARLNGLHDSTAVLRLYTPDRFSAAAVAATALRSNGMLHIPRRIGQSNRYGALLLEWLPGASLREVLAREYDALPVLERVGAALALLHGQSARRLPGPPTASHVAGSLESAAVRALQPQLARSAADVAALIQLLLANRPAPLRPLHGDFHMDQVVVMHSGIGFVDLDRAHRGDPAADLGNFLANLERDAIDAKVAATALPAMRDALLGGYGGGDPALRERVHLHTAAALLRLVAEPFRCRATDWPDQMQRIVTRAGEIALLATDDVACRT
jgi:aminoglycoside phosphotransferase (APT) family kinase protein